MERIEMARNIESRIEKIVEDFMEVLQYLRTNNADECEELQNLLFASCRVAEIIDSSLEIHHYLIRLKYLEANAHKEEVENKNKVDTGFKRLFNELNRDVV